MRLGSSPLGGTVPKRPPLALAMPGRVAAMTDDQRLAFAQLKPAAVCIVSTDGPVSLVLRQHVAAGVIEKRYGGGNRGCRPARLVVSGAWSETASQTWDRSPFAELAFRVQARLWCLGTDHARAAVEAFGPWLAARLKEQGVPQEMLVHGCLDLGPNPLEETAALLFSATGRASAFTFTDAELLAFMDLGCKLAAKRGCGVDYMFRVRQDEISAAWAKPRTGRTQ
jgi:hypothetical protein